MKNRFKHTALVMLLAFTLPKMGSAQQALGAFMMSSVGNLENMSNNSIALNFSSNTSCLNIQNGTAVIIGERGLGTFSNNCEANTKVNTLGIKLYPNPVSNKTKVKFINTPPLSEQFSITIWNADGYKMSASQANGFEIFQGLLLNTKDLLSGTYIIHIESEKYIDALKFIKAN